MQNPDGAQDALNEPDGTDCNCNRSAVSLMIRLPLIWSHISKRRVDDECNDNPEAD